MPVTDGKLVITLDATGFETTLASIPDHSSRHESGGADEVKLDTLGAPTDVTTLNTSTSTHGLCPKLSGYSTQFLDGTGAWSVPAGGSGGGLDYPGSSTVYLNGNGVWATPASSGSVFKPAVYIGMTGSGADYICDGTADNVQIQQALDAVTSGTQIIFLPGTYSITSTISQQNKDLYFKASGKVIFNVNISTSEAPAFDLYGHSVLTTTLSASPSINANTVTLTSVSGVAAGQLLVVNNTTDYTLDDADFKIGEMYDIRGVSGSTVTIGDPLFRSYSSTNAVRVFSPVSITFDGFEFVGTSSTSDMIGVALTYVKDCNFVNCKFKKFGVGNIYIYTGYNINVSNCTISESEVSGYGYGVACVNASAKIKVDHCSITSCRHTVTSGVGNDFNGLNRDILVSNSTLGGSFSGTGAVDAHPSTLNWKIDNCVIYSTATGEAVGNGAQFFEFTNNHCYGGGGILTRGTLKKNVNMSVICEGNYFYNGFCYTDSGPDTYDILKISNNHIYGGDTCVNLSDNTRTMGTLQINGNSFKDSTNYSIYIYLSSTTAAANISIVGNNFNGCTKSPIRIIMNTTYRHLIKISENTFFNYNTAGSAYAGIWGTGIKWATITNNKFVDSNASNALGIELESGCDYNIVTGNDAGGMTGTKFSLAGSNNTTTPANISL